MTESASGKISVTEPVSEAIEKTIIFLFKPFNIGKWFVLGFAAWLMSLAQGGGFNFNFGGNNAGNLANCANQFAEFCRIHTVLVAFLIGVFAVLFLTLFVVCLWLSSRGYFIFVDCLAKNNAEIKRPWNNLKIQANSLFKFRLALAAAAAAGVLAIFVPVSFVVVALKGSALGVFAILGLIFATFALVCWLIALSLAAIFMKDFIIPIMYIRRCKIIAAWQEFFSMIRGNLWRFFCYILFKIVIAFCVSTIAALAICLSCCSCCLWIIFVIPYISTVAMLPLISFGRLYPLCYLRQYGPELDVFSAVAVQDKPN